MTAELDQFANLIADDIAFIRSEGASEAQIRAHAAGLMKELHRAEAAGELMEDAPINERWADESGRFRGSWGK